MKTALKLTSAQKSQIRDVLHGRKHQRRGLVVLGEIRENRHKAEGESGIRAGTGVRLPTGSGRRNKTELFCENSPVLCEKGLLAQTVNYGLIPVSVFGAVEIYIFRRQVSGIDHIFGFALIEVDFYRKLLDLYGIAQFVGRRLGG